MLVEIQCDAFKHKEPIKFKDGLNVVLGANDGANSIGKSTLLMVIDFVFGGSDYTDKSLDTIKNVGEHQINFAFQFEGTMYYFSRDTSSPTEVSICDNNYSKIKIINLNDYTNLLKEKYKINSSYISFRETVSNFIRVYHRDNYDETAPLRSFKQDTQNKGLKRLFKLLNEYEEIDLADKRYQEYKEKKETFNKSLKYNYIYATPNKTEYKKNEIEINNLRKQKENLVLDLGETFAGLDEYQRNKLAELREQQRLFSNKILTYQLQLNSMKYDQKFSSSKLKSDLLELEKFFPNLNVAEIVEIEQFHDDLNSILKKQVADNTKKIDRELKKYNELYFEVDRQIEEIKDSEKIPQDKLQNYTEVDRKIIKLEKANEAYDNKELIAEETKKRKEHLDHTVDLAINSIESTLNQTMHEINEKVTNGQKMAPLININSITSYHFEIPNDTGTGTNFRGLVVFDLAILTLSFLPLLVHDSLIFKQVEDNAIENILKIYSTFDKQIFISFDKQSAYSDEVKSLLYDNHVIELGPNGNELFGKSWSSVENNQLDEKKE
ncbi:DUF2326 domain-containing protein [Falseniella ignava]|uniref:DUF2326 domain-containing protein n=1 Tax=Falseniella ignava CCUG 37419 TaxID=883112 RepID=K1LAT0_9LACT|nr:DUF2326 domain-containing protein [Falseniella ignava]EKB53610.1 hypothetical protein HMPREF9707_01635 [Falseniella ignava CCUG 37419]